MFYYDQKITYISKEHTTRVVTIKHVLSILMFEINLITNSPTSKAIKKTKTHDREEPITEYDKS